MLDKYGVLLYVKFCCRKKGEIKHMTRNFLVFLFDIFYTHIINTKSSFLKHPSNSAIFMKLGHKLIHTNLRIERFVSLVKENTSVEDFLLLSIPELYIIIEHNIIFNNRLIEILLLELKPKCILKNSL
jgi:hypothetical protein